MNFRWLQFVVVVAGAVVSGCGREMPAEDLRAHLEQEFQTRYIAPYVAADTEAWLQVFADDVVALHDGLPALNGKVAIREFGDTVAQNFAIQKLDAVVDEVRQEGRWAWTRGHFDALFAAKTTAAPSGVAGARSGKFLLIWEQQDDGEWLVIMDMGNSLQPLPGSAQQ